MIKLKHKITLKNHPSWLHPKLLCLFIILSILMATNVKVRSVNEIHKGIIMSGLSYISSQILNHKKICLILYVISWSSKSKYFLLSYSDFIH